MIALETANLEPLRQEVYRRFNFGHVVRTEAARMAQSAVLRRIFLFGIEESASRYSAREVLQFLAMCDGVLADNLARIAFTRAVAEDDAEVLQVYADIVLFPDLLAWLSLLQASDETALQQHLATLAAGSEELAVNRLAAGRRFPALCQASWPWEIPAAQRRLRFAMARLIAVRRPDLHAALAGFLTEHKDALLGGDPDEILAPLVRLSAQRPQAFLAPFEQYYDEGTLIAAAEWHLEHDERGPAQELAGRIRDLSVHRDRALHVRALARLDDGAMHDAARLMTEIDDAAERTPLAVRIAEEAPSLISTAQLAEIGERDIGSPELLHRLLMVLLKRKELSLARTICRNRWRDFAVHPALGPIMRTIDPSLV